LTFQNQKLRLNHYFFFSYILVLVLCEKYLSLIPFSDLRTSLFALMVWLTYGFIYLLPSLSITKLTHWVFNLVSGKQMDSGWMSYVVYAVALVTTTATAILIYSDRSLYHLYGFHLNGFVWNLLTTRGGIESLGGSDATMVTYLAIFAGFSVAQMALFWGAGKLAASRKQTRSSRLRKVYRYALALLLLMTLSERVVYGISNLQAYRSVLVASEAFPFYQPLTFRSLANQFGYQVRRDAGIEFNTDYSTLAYPLSPLKVKQPHTPLNIVWLVAESWRSDMLDPEIMPATWAFAQKGVRFAQHYSGGIGTRMGLFTMFYGLYGPYWFPFLNERKSPVIMDVLQDQDYQLGLYTSAKFSYPEFDKTIFSHVPNRFLHEFSSDAGWKSDRKNVTDMLSFIKNRDQSRPFMSFMFFESPHARYYFPEKSVIRNDYLKEFNYAGMSLERDIRKIKNRYINSCHHLDSQFQRVFTFLKKEHLLENTIVIITGDHGEEFMEKGRWGHNSEFTEEQMRVPLILRIPNIEPTRVNRMTSHLDIAPTLLPILGVKNRPDEVSLGINLFGKEPPAYIIANDWSRLCYISENYKEIFPFRAYVFQNRITTRKDVPVDDPGNVIVETQYDLRQIMQNLGRFKKRKGA
jgi:membrane-anchored protein YejM (alkaline phosphatase superfamily)